MISCNIKAMSCGVASWQRVRKKGTRQSEPTPPLTMRTAPYVSMERKDC